MKTIKCPVCQDFIKEPQKVKPCKHRICLRCINKARELSSGEENLKCPKCAIPVKGVSLDELFNEYVEEYISKHLKEEHPCELHTNEAYFLLCLDCGYVPVCKTCIVDNHKGHTLVDAENSNEIKKEIETQIMELKENGKMDLNIFNKSEEEFKTSCNKWEKSRAIGLTKSTIKVYAEIHKFYQMKEHSEKKSVDESSSVIQFELTNYLSKTKQKKKDIELFMKLDKESIHKDIYGSIILLKSVQQSDKLIKDSLEAIASFPNYPNKYHFNEEILSKIKALSKYLFVPYHCKCQKEDEEGDLCQCYQEYLNSPHFTNSQFGKELTLILNPPPLSLAAPMLSNGFQSNYPLTSAINQPLSIEIYKAMAENTPRGAAPPQDLLSPIDYKNAPANEPNQKNNKKQPEVIASNIPKIKCLYFLCGMEDKLHLSRCIKYYPIRDEWAFMPPTKHKRACVTDATVVAKNYIYVFGGNDSLESYEKFNITSGRWENGGNIPSGGGSSMSAAYDGQDSIYLVGGVKFNVTSNRIDKCTITQGQNGKEPTLSFQLITNMKTPRYYCFTLVHEKQLYIIGGTNKTRDDSYFTVINNIEVLNLETKKISMFLEYLDDHDNRVEGIAFDGVYIYIMTIEHFYTLHIHQKTKGKYLDYPPIENMRFGYSLTIGTDSVGDTVIYLIGDRGSNHYYYKIKENKWYTQQSRRPIASYFHGCGIEYEESKVPVAAK